MTFLDKLAAVALHPRLSALYGDDCVQDAYILAMGRVKQFDCKRGNLAQWFGRIVRNLFRDNVRREHAAYRLRHKRCSLDNIVLICPPLKFGSDAPEHKWPELVAKTRLADSAKTRLSALVDTILYADDMPSTAQLAQRLDVSTKTILRMFVALREQVLLAS